ncbi:MAG TPA: heme exporter protein CcmB [Nocardioidaceae bacterium]|nr:heme exporter protein CcmB [Nocardioidaceae bacterium]
MSTVVTLVRRELRLEASGREATSTVLPFVLAAVLLAGLAMGPSRELLRSVAPGVVWLVVLFAAPALARSVAAAEREDGTWDTLRGLVPPMALLAGKIGGLWLHYLVTWAVAAALVTVMFPAPMPLPGLVAGPVGTLGLAGLTVAFGALLVGARRRTGLLAVLLLPLALPVLLAGVTLGTPGHAHGAWTALLVGYDVLVLVTVWAVHPALLEE